MTQLSERVPRNFLNRINLNVDFKLKLIPGKDKVEKYDRFWCMSAN